MNRNVFALFGAVAVLLTVPVVLTLSRATPFASGILGDKRVEGAVFETTRD